MATKIECDRCGKIVTKKDPCEVSPVTIDYVKKHNDNGHVTSLSFNQTEIERTKDLCASCQKLVLDVFNEVLPKRDNA